MDGVTLSNQGKHFYDLTLHFFEFSSGSLLESSWPKMVCHNPLLAESGNCQTAQEIKLLLPKHLTRKYSVDLDYFLNSFTLVTDWAAVMPNIAGASVSTNVAPFDLKWMGCAAQQINTVMRTVMKIAASDPVLNQVTEQLKAVKDIVRVFKQSKLNGELRDGKTLIQEIETRFATTPAVVGRFLFSSHDVFDVIERKGSHALKRAKDELLIAHANSEHWGLSALEAICDACYYLVTIQKKLEASTSPTLHLFLPMIQKCKDELRRIARCGTVDRRFSRGRINPSSFSKLLCRLMRGTLSEKIIVHDLWIVGCLLHHFLREIQFLPLLDVRHTSPGDSCL